MTLAVEPSAIGRATTRSRNDVDHSPSQRILGSPVIPVFTGRRRAKKREAKGHPGVSRLPRARNLDDYKSTVYLFLPLRSIWDSDPRESPRRIFSFLF